MTSQENRLTLQRYRTQLVKERQRQRRAERADKQVDFSSSDDEEQQVQDTTDPEDQIASFKKAHHEQFLNACAAGDWTPISLLLMSPFLYRSTIEEGRKLAFDKGPHYNLIKKLDYYLEHELNILHVDKW